MIAQILKNFRPPGTCKKVNDEVRDMCDADFYLLPKQLHNFVARQ